MTTIRPLAVEMLRLVHREPGITRVDAARRLGISTGTASDLVGSLVREDLVTEQHQRGAGRRGRPTRELVASPEGPIVLAAAIRHNSWQLDAVALGNQRVWSETGANFGSDGHETLAALAAGIEAACRRFRGRVRGLGVAAPGVIYDGRRLDATMLGWHDLDLRQIWHEAPIFAAGNDATLAAVAEVLRGSAGTSSLTVHLHVDVGLGGALLQNGVVVEGAHGAAGEFGHLPMGDPSAECPCGAYGCWGASVDGSYLARLLGDVPPSDPVAYAHQILTRAGSGDRAARAGIAGVAQILGRGVAGLVNALDADLVVLSGLAPEIVGAARDSFDRSYLDGLMSSRRVRPVAVRHASLGEQGPITGAAESVWTRFWDVLRGPGTRRTPLREVPAAGGAPS